MKSFIQKHKEKIKVLWQISTACFLVIIWLVIDMQLLSNKYRDNGDNVGLPPVPNQVLNSSTGTSDLITIHAESYTDTDRSYAQDESQYAIPLKEDQAGVNSNWGIFIPYLSQANNLAMNENFISKTNSSKIHEVSFLPNSKKIYIDIQPASKLINTGKKIRITFIPGVNCEYGKNRACIYQFTTSTMNQIYFISIHSGLGGDGQRLRHLIEGTGINRTGFDLKRIHSNMKLLISSDVSLSQGNIKLTGLELIRIIRISPKDLPRYFSTPVERIPTLLLTLKPDFQATLKPGEKYLILETCGWKLPGETLSWRVSDTTGSVYLSVIKIND